MKYCIQLLLVFFSFSSLSQLTSKEIELILAGHTKLKSTKEYFINSLKNLGLMYKELDAPQIPMIRISYDLPGKRSGFYLDININKRIVHISPPTDQEESETVFNLFKEVAVNAPHVFLRIEEEIENLIVLEKVEEEMKEIYEEYFLELIQDYFATSSFRKTYPDFFKIVEESEKEGRKLKAIFYLKKGRNKGFVSNSKGDIISLDIKSESFDFQKMHSMGFEIAIGPYNIFSKQRKVIDQIFKAIGKDSNFYFNVDTGIHEHIGLLTPQEFQKAGVELVKFERRRLSSNKYILRIKSIEDYMMIKKMLKNLVIVINEFLRVDKRSSKTWNEKISLLTNSYRQKKHARPVENSYLEKILVQTDNIIKMIELNKTKGSINSAIENLVNIKDTRNLSINIKPILIFGTIEVRAYDGSKEILSLFNDFNKHILRKLIKNPCERLLKLF